MQRRKQGDWPCSVYCIHADYNFLLCCSTKLHVDKMLSFFVIFKKKNMCLQNFSRLIASLFPDKKSVYCFVRAMEMFLLIGDFIQLWETSDDFSASMIKKYLWSPLLSITEKMLFSLICFGGCLLFVQRKLSIFGYNSSGIQNQYQIPASDS